VKATPSLELFADPNPPQQDQCGPLDVAAGFGTFLYRVWNFKGESRVVRAFFPKTACEVSGYGDAVLRIDGPLGVGIWPEIGRLLMGNDLPNIAGQRRPGGSAEGRSL
jgi:hypothetical protein